MITTILRENVLTDDVLYLAEDDKVFAGGYKAILEYHTFGNEWSDVKHVKRFRTLENAKKYISKQYN